MSQQADVVSRQTPVFVVTLVTAILATITVAARLTSRFGIVRRATRDDYLIICAWIVATGLSFSVSYGTSKGLGLKDADINTAWFPALRKAEYSFSVLYYVALVLTKSSILTFYLRLSRNTNKLLRIASWLTLGVVVLAGTVLTFLNVFQCTPIGAVFDPDENPNAKCFSIVTLYLCSAPVNIITDLAVLVLPLPVLTSMRLPGKQKTILIATFALGVFVIVVDVVRIFYLQQSATSVAIGTMSQSRIGGQLDFAWNASLALMWSAVEVNVGIICANIPTLKPLIKQILPSMITDYPSHESSDTEKTSSFTSQAPLDANRHSIRLSPIAAEDHAPGSIRPLPPAQLGGNQEQEIGLMGFLTAPESIGVTSTQTHRTGGTENSVYFGFVNMNGPKSMLKYNLRESFKSCSYVTTLFFLWGFSYGILNTLNNQISKVARTSTGQTLGLESMYFAGYLVGPLTVARYILQRWGFKATFITGLSIYGVGTLMFWPSAVLTSYPGFILSNFVVGLGLSILETAANPFLALCGSDQYSEVRLLIAQGVQAVGSIASQVLAEKVLFRGARSIANNPSLIDVQWTYLAIALFSVVLAVIFFYIPLPEASDDDLREQAENLGIHSSEKFSIHKLPVVYTTLALAVLAQFFYVGAQQGASFYFQGVLVHLASTTGIPLTISPISYSTLSLVTFASGRFLAAALCYIITPRILLLVIFIGGILSSSLIVGLGSVSPNIVAAPALIFFFFEGPVFPMLFAIGLRGLGDRTKAGAAYLTAAVSGGAVFPLIMYAIQHHNGQTIQMSFCVTIALFATCLLFSVYLNASSKVRHQVDPRIAIRNNDERPLTPIRRFSKQFQNIVRGKQRKGSADLPVVEHRERRSWASGATKP